MGESLLLELPQRLAECRLEARAPIAAGLEHVEVLQDAVEAHALDQVVGQQKHELIGGL